MLSRSMRRPGMAFDMLTNPVITVEGDRAEGRWFLFTLLVDPDTKEAAWNSPPWTMSMRA